MIKKIVLQLIKLYQKTLSPDTGWLAFRHPHGYCRFYPHCSEYAYQAIANHGVLIGIKLALIRIIKCHPWSKGGIDLVPDKN